MKTIGDLERDLYTAVDERDVEAHRLCEQLGFVINRRESAYVFPTDPDATRLRAVQSPPEFRFLSADHVQEDRLRTLDDALRQDVPGTDGWKWDEAGFRDETFDSAFDPTTYLVVVEQAKGEYAGLVRVWNNPEAPRLGLIAVLAPYRRRGLARALLAAVFRVLHERGKTHVTAEVDDANVASRSLIESLGGRRTGGVVEYVRRAEASWSAKSS